MQRLHFEGFVAEEFLTLTEAPAQPEDGMSHRTVDTGAQVIDLQEMIRQSKAS
jgi:hypothetical protein